MLIDWIKKHQFSCVVKSNLGFECPGCGTQRALIALLKGDIAGSFVAHPGVILFLVTFFILILQLFIKHKKGGWAIMGLFILSVTTTMANYVLRFFY